MSCELFVVGCEGYALLWGYTYDVKNSGPHTEGFEHVHGMFMFMIKAA